MPALRCNRYHEGKALDAYFWEIHVNECDQCLDWFNQFEKSIHFPKPNFPTMNGDVFENQISDVMSKIETRKIQKIRINRWKAGAIAVAATLLIVFNVNYLLNLSTMTEINLSDLSYGEILNLTVSPVSVDFIDTFNPSVDEIEVILNTMTQNQPVYDILNSEVPIIDEEGIDELFQQMKQEREI